MKRFVAVARRHLPVVHFVVDSSLWVVAIPQGDGRHDDELPRRDARRPPDVQARTIFVDTMGVKSTDFDLDGATQAALFDSGVAAAQRFLDGWDFDAYVAAHRSA